jgi:hypothetical protein
MSIIIESFQTWRDTRRRRREFKNLWVRRSTNRIETLRYGVANREAAVAGAKVRAEANPSISTYWVQLDRAEWALADLRQQLADAERTQS